MADIDPDPKPKNKTKKSKYLQKCLWDGWVWGAEGCHSGTVGAETQRKNDFMWVTILRTNVF